MHYHLVVTCYIPSHECSAVWCALLSPQLASRPLDHNTSHRGFLDCAHWMRTWFSGYICFGASVFIVQLYMIHDYFNIKLNLYWIEEISAIISLSQVIRKTMVARYGLTRLEPIFWKIKRVFFTTQIPNIKQQNGPNIVIQAINIEVYVTDNTGWLQANTWLFTFSSGNVHFGGRGHFASLWLPWRQHNEHHHLTINI